MSSNKLIRGSVLVAILGCLFTLNSAEARNWREPRERIQTLEANTLANQVDDIQAQYNNQLSQLSGPNLDRLDSDDEDEDDDRVQLQSATLPQQTIVGNNFYQSGQQFAPLTSEQTGAYQQPSGAGDDLRTAASKHHGHHKHGAKGWLDMGAWTGKKGAFGWYDKHPVGKGK